MFDKSYYSKLMLLSIANAVSSLQYHYDSIIINELQKEPTEVEILELKRKERLKAAFGKKQSRWK